MVTRRIYYIFLFALLLVPTFGQLNLTSNRSLALGPGRQMTNTDLTIAHENKLARLLNQNTNALPVIRISYEGDSIVNQDLPTWPDFIATYSAYFARAAYVTNYGANGARASQMPGQYATESFLNRPNLALGEEGWFFLHGGGNDISDGVATATVYQYLKNLWAAARIDGYKVVAVTVTPREYFGGTEDAAVIELNRLILSDPTLYDYCVRMDQVLSDPTDTAIYYDGTHPSVQGAHQGAQTVVNTIEVKPFLLMPTATGSTNGTSMDLQFSRVRRMALGGTNTTARMTIAESFVAPTDGISTNTVLIVANNNAANASAGLSILARSSAWALLNLGNENREDYVQFRGDFADGDLGLGIRIFGTERFRLNTSGAQVIGTFATSETGGTGHYLKQTTAGGNYSSGLIGAADIPDPIVPPDSVQNVTGSVTVSSGIVAGGSVQVGAAGGFNFATRGGISATADGVILLRNEAVDGFTILQLGGTSASFPGLKRSGTAIEIRLANDSALAPLRASQLRLSSLNIYTNNAAAIAAGLVAGDLYRSGADPDVVSIVH
jgi:hypothetical protein